MRNEVFSLIDLIDYHDHQISSRGLSRKLNIDLPISLYAMAAGESISSEETSLTKLIQVIDGTLEIIMAEKTFTLTKGDIITIVPDTLHELHAKERCKFLQIEGKAKELSR